MSNQGMTSLVAMTMLEEGYIWAVAADTTSGLNFLCTEGVSYMCLD